MWIEYDTKFGKQYVDSETQENIQAYGNDKRYPEFKKKLDSGEIVPVKWEDSEQYKEAIAKQEAAIAEMKMEFK